MLFYPFMQSCSTHDWTVIHGEGEAPQHRLVPARARARACPTCRRFHQRGGATSEVEAPPSQRVLCCAAGLFCSLRHLCAAFEPQNYTGLAAHRICGPQQTHTSITAASAAQRHHVTTTHRKNGGEGGHRELLYGGGGWCFSHCGYF